MSPSLYHSSIMGMIVFEIMKDKKFRARPELSILIDGDEHIPDISVYKRKEINYLGKDIPKTEELPLLSIEILSPSQTMDDLYDKAEIYLKAGIKSVWLVSPQSHAIIVKTKTETNHFHEGILEDITGVRADIGIIFED